MLFDFWTPLHQLSQHKCCICWQMFSAQTVPFSSPSLNTSEVDLPLPDRGVQTLPVAALDGVVVVQVLLLVLLHRGGRRWLLSGEDLCCHLLLLLGCQGDDLIAHRGQLGRAAGTPLFGAFTGLALN